MRSHSTKRLHQRKSAEITKYAGLAHLVVQQRNQRASAAVESAATDCLHGAEDGAQLRELQRVCGGCARVLLCLHHSTHRTAGV